MPKLVFLDSQNGLPLFRWPSRDSYCVAGEPVSEHDFSLGSDIVGDILRGARSTERMSLSCLVVLLVKLKWVLMRLLEQWAGMAFCLDRGA
jgi:hypothetical protein